MKKKITALVTVLVMLVTAMIVPFGADTTLKQESELTIIVDTVEVEPGEDFTFNVSLSNVPEEGISAIGFAVKYDYWNFETHGYITINKVEVGGICDTGASEQEANIFLAAGQIDAVQAQTWNCFSPSLDLKNNVVFSWTTGLTDDTYWIKENGVFATVYATLSADAPKGTYLDMKAGPIPAGAGETNIGYYTGNSDEIVEYTFHTVNGGVNVGGEATVPETSVYTTVTPAVTTPTGTTPAPTPTTTPAPTTDTTPIPTDTTPAPTPSETTPAPTPSETTVAPPTDTTPTETVPTTTTPAPTDTTPTETVPTTTTPAPTDTTPTETVPTTTTPAPTDTTPTETVPTTETTPQPTETTPAPTTSITPLPTETTPTETAPTADTADTTVTTVSTDGSEPPATTTEEPLPDDFVAHWGDVDVSGSTNINDIIVLFKYIAGNYDRSQFGTPDGDGGRLAGSRAAGTYNANVFWESGEEGFAEANNPTGTVGKPATINVADIVVITNMILGVYGGVGTDPADEDVVQKKFPVSPETIDDARVSK